MKTSFRFRSFKKSTALFNTRWHRRPRNFGAILRTAECAGVDIVFIPERRAVGLTETVAKTSAGAIFDVKVARSTNINRLIDRFKRQNFWVVGADAEAKMLYTDWDWTQSTALVLGSEGEVCMN